ncbi:hypothetical protein AB205_0053450 [Aquarana catesbeiana]|uniref:Uncharacterized protein n=1 Tax=Aquarana catesbeiana TaxID=8400 RepID=A0A2G9SIF1_AQUCT|nr:hypothetical protein AB205_0053450 [Aquarana catesbeiana]
MNGQLQDIPMGLAVLKMSVTVIELTVTAYLQPNNCQFQEEVSSYLLHDYACFVAVMVVLSVILGWEQAERKLVVLFAQHPKNKALEKL